MIPEAATSLEIALEISWISVFARFPAFRQLFRDFLVFFRVGIAETQVFQFPFDLPDSQPVGERCKNIECLLCDPAALCLREGSQGAHVVQAVGQLDQHHAHIAVHRQEGFSQGFRGQVFFSGAFGSFFIQFPVGFVCLPQGFFLVLAPGYARQLGQLGHPLDKVGNALPEIPAQGFILDGGIFDRVVQQTGRDDIRRHGILGQDRGHGQAVVYIRLPGCTFLACVRFFRQPVGALD